MSTDKIRPLYIRYAGPVLLETPLLNKGSAFSETERHDFNLKGLLPITIETIDEQEKRAYQQFSSFENVLDNGAKLGGSAFGFGSTMSRFISGCFVVGISQFVFGVVKFQYFPLPIMEKGNRTPL